VPRLARSLAVLTLTLVGLATLFVVDTRLPPRSSGEPPLTLDVPPRASAERIGRELFALGMVRHPLEFRLLVRLHGAGERLRAGRYTIEATDSLEDVLRLLQRGEAERHDVTFPEGRTLEDMAAQAAGAGVPGEGFMAAAHDPAPIRDLDPDARDLEGYLFPDTYDVPQGPDAARALVLRMVQRFRRVIAPERGRIAASGLSLRQIVTLASLVELETGRAAERPRIAAVFLNRLAKGMLLQTDPTVIFALRQAGRWDGNIRKKDLSIDSPYNTYRYPGLPPGPIGSPGRAALLAVLAPAPVKDLYFVSRNDGTHQFSESLREHERAVDLYQRHRSRLASSPRLPSK
jgi:UPF0755 protein